jgi:hypothetical protein
VRSSPRWASTRHTSLWNEGVSALFMSSQLTPEMPSSCVTNLRNSWLLRAIRALNLNISGTICFAQNKPETPETKIAILCAVHEHTTCKKIYAIIHHDSLF